MKFGLEFECQGSCLVCRFPLLDRATAEKEESEEAEEDDDADEDHGLLFFLQPCDLDRSVI